MSILTVTLRCCTSIIEAHESKIDFMRSSMANKIPRGEEKGIRLMHK